MPGETQRLSGMHALVTGAGRGVGLGIAQALAREGCHVAVNYPAVGSRAEAEAAADLLRQSGIQAVVLEGDVRHADSVSRMFQNLREHWPRLDLLVNNAGVQVAKHLLDLSEDEWNTVIDTNLKGCLLCTQAAGRWMRDTGGGSIVNIGSGSNKLAFPRLVSYVASKGGIEMFTKSAAVELGPLGIRVNCVAPGAIVTERTLTDDPAYEKTWGEITPLGRAGTPADVGDAVVYFASPLSRFVTGQTLWVDGGVFTRAPWPYEVQ
jgi:3-oxoacyl-[acyl-carrier protein] reductase